MVTLMLSCHYCMVWQRSGDDIRAMKTEYWNHIRNCPANTPGFILPKNKERNDE